MSVRKPLNDKVRATRDKKKKAKEARLNGLKKYWLIKKQTECWDAGTVLSEMPYPS